MKTRTAAAAAAICAALAAAAHVALVKASPVKTPAVGEGVINALGGLRSIASEAVWFRAERMQEQCRFGELAQLASVLTFLEPHEPEVWIYSAWNLAYNVSVKMPSPEDRWPWIAEALRLLRDEGLKWNPSSARICREIAFIFEIKIGTDIDAAAPIYRREWKKLVEAAAASGDWESLGMDEARMRALEKETGMDDWTNPETSAMYWARRGLETADDSDRPFLNEIVRLSRILYDRKTKDAK